jgi:hypothetical protein
MSEVLRDGEKGEREFLPRLRTEYARQLQIEIERSRGESPERNAPASQRPSREAQRLHGLIERIELRLAMLEAEAPTPPPPN